MLKAKNFILPAAALLLLCGCRGTKDTQSSGIQVIPASVGNISRSVTFVGNVTSAQSSELTWKTNGVIEEVFVQLGDTVTEGQVLATLSNDSLKASVIEAEPPLLQAKDDYEDLLESETAKAQAYKDMRDAAKALADAEQKQESLLYPRDISLNASYWKEQADSAKKSYDDAKQRLDDIISYEYSTVKSEKDVYDQRKEEMVTELNKYAEAYNNYLYYTGNSTQNEKDQAAADLDIAKNNYEKALKNFQTYEEYPRQKDLNQAQLAIDNAQKTYDTRSVIADINGVISSVNAFQGHYVTASQNAFRLDNTEHLYIPVDISEIDINGLKDGMKAEIRLDAAPEILYQGEVATIEASGTEDASRVTFGTLIELKNPEDKVRVGMTAEVKIILAERGSVLIVPSNAIYTENGQNVVDLALPDGTTQSVPVVVGLTTETVSEILSGLEEGDNVCVPSVDPSILQDMGIETATVSEPPVNTAPTAETPANQAGADTQEETIDRPVETKENEGKQEDENTLPNRFPSNGEPPQGMPPMGEPPAGFPGGVEPPQGAPFGNRPDNTNSQK